MKILIQRVKHSKCTVDGKEISKIGQGMLVFVGITNDDTTEDIEWTNKKRQPSILYRCCKTRNFRTTIQQVHRNHKPNYRQIVCNRNLRSRHEDRITQRWTSDYNYRLEK